MHKITCSNCGKEAEVPFVPEPGRAVFCKECVAKIKAGTLKATQVAPKPSVRPPAENKPDKPARPAAAKPADKKPEPVLHLDNLKETEPKLPREPKPADEEKINSLRAALKDALDKAK